MRINLEGQTAVVTGGSRGIGAATVTLLAQAGAHVVFSYRRAESAAETLIRETSVGGRRVLAVLAEPSRMEEAKALIDAVMGHFGHLDILVANAGIWNAEPLPIEKMSEAEWDEMMDVNAKGVYAVIRHAAPPMIAQQSGRIIVVSSTAGQRGEAFHTHYGASKGALISFVKGLSTELAPHHILVNCVAPGWVHTDMCASVTGDPDEVRRVNSGIPLRRMARPEEIAMPILFLASEMASYITGEVLNVNGGNVLCG
jgi:3-oxoacyl-[acyl-carrier protein] reductase